MYKKNYFKSLLLLCALIVGSTSAWAETTETLTISNYAETHNWVNDTKYTSAQVGVVSFSATGGSNTGKYYSSDNSWRFYSNENATLTISVPEGNTLVSVKPTFTVKDSGTLKFGNSNCTSGTAISVSGNSAVFTISQSSGNKGKVFFTAIEVTYRESGTIIPTCDTPTFNPESGEVLSGTEVAISTNTTGATIYYTTDGSTPSTSSNVYSEPIVITEATTIKAYAVKTDYNDSEVATAVYTIKQVVQVPGYTIDFESDIDAYVDWAFTNVGNTNTAISAHGGSKYGANINASGNGTNTLTIQTKEIVALPNELTCYVSKTSKNTTTSNWYVQVSTDGNTWTNVTTSSATDMTQGEWKTITANLSSYSDVYVRISYGSSNAIRAIDDISLTMRDANTKVTPTIVIDDTSLTNDLAGENNVSAGTVTAAVMDGQTAVENVSVTWSSSNTDVATIDATTGAVTLIATGTTTLTATFAGNDDYNEASGTYELTVINSYAAGSANNPFSVAEALAAITNGDFDADTYYYVSGIISQIGEVNTTQYYNATYFISDDGQTTTQLEVYRGKYLDNANFTSADQIQVGDEVVIYGKLIYYHDETPEIAQGNYLVSQERVEYYLTGTFNSWSDKLSEMEKLEKNNEGKYSTTMTISENTDFKIRRKNLDGSLTWIGAQAEGSYYLVLSDGDIQMNENGGQNVKFETAGEYTFTFDVTTYKLNVTGFPAPPVPVYYLKGDFNNWGNDDPFVHQGNGIYTISKHVGATQAFKIVDENDGWYSNNSFSRDNCTELGLYTNNSNMTTGVEGDFVFTLNTAGSTMTLTVTGWPTTIDGNMFVRVISDTDLTDGAYLIVCEDGNVAFDGSLTTLDATNNTIGVTISNGTIVGDATTMASLFYIEGNTNKTIKSASGLYIGNTSNSNDLEESDVTAYTNTITIEDGYADIYSSGGAHLRYNSANDQARFRYYKSSSYSSQQAIQLYKLVTLPAVTFSENDAEATTITTNANKLVNATLERTLSNTYWSTFSVPFNVTAEQIAEALGTVELREFDGSEGTVIKFQEATTIEAGHAYLVKPAATVTNPVFNGVTVVNTTGKTDESNGYGFVGAVIKKTLKTDQTELFLGTDAKFYYPESDAVATMKGLRGYFVVPAGTKTSKLSVDVEGSGIATSINSMNIEGMGDGNIYNLNGQRVNAPQKGLYIVNGKKVIIK